MSCLSWTNSSFRKHFILQEEMDNRRKLCIHQKVLHSLSNREYRPKDKPEGDFVQVLCLMSVFLNNVGVSASKQRKQ